jgi:hypothetical protein
MKKPAFVFPREAYPILIEALHPDIKSVVWSKAIEAPDSDETVALHIPPMRKQLGHPVNIRVTFAKSYESGSAAEVELALFRRLRCLSSRREHFGWRRIFSAGCSRP